MVGEGNRQRGEKGQYLVLGALLMVVLLGFTALTVDAGMIFLQRRDMQTAADAAALAGASAMPPFGSVAEAQGKAIEWAENNGYVNGVDDVTVTVTTPYQGDASKIEVKISGSEPALFSRVLGESSFPVTARAVATATYDTQINAAILALSPNSCDSFRKSGNSNITINNNGGIMVNSACNPSISRVGAGSVTAAAINYYEEGGVSESGSGALIPTPTSVGSPIPDPLASTPPPDLAALGQSPDSGGTPLNPALKKITTGSATLRPGVYYGGISLSTTGTVTFEPGIYVLAGGGFSLKAAGTFIGNGVMFYNTFDPQKNVGAGACGLLDLGGGGVYTFTGPTSGTYEDIVFWQDKACTGAMKMTGGGGGTGGVVYLPGATLDVSGGGPLGSIQIIANMVEFSGTGDASVDFYPYIQIPLSPGIRLIE